MEEEEEKEKGMETVGSMTNTTNPKKMIKMMKCTYTDTDTIAAAAVEAGGGGARAEVEVWKG